MGKKIEGFILKRSYWIDIIVFVKIGLTDI
jgi:hypothetical protein